MTDLEEIELGIIYDGKTDRSNPIAKHEKEVRSWAEELLKDKPFPVEFFSNYISWNSIFAGCVVNLVSRFHLWPYIGERPDPVADPYLFKNFSALGNRHFHSVSSYIFAAAEDEYDEAGNKIKYERVAHKDMAWHFIKELYSYHNMDIKTRQVSEFTNHMNTKVLEGYGHMQRHDVPTLVRNLGFHIGSEKLASLEFQYLNDAIKEFHPDVYKHLESKEMTGGITAIDWIKVHGTVEIEHFNNALTAAKIIIDFMNKTDSQGMVDTFNYLREGFAHFANHQRAYFKGSM